jgi:hypothetical protein
MSRTTLLIVIAVTMVVSVLVDILTRGLEYDEWWYPLPGFPAMLGLVGCIAIIVASKLLGYYWIQKREDYYKEERGND